MNISNKFNFIPLTKSRLFHSSSRLGGLHPSLCISRNQATEWKGRLDDNLPNIKQFPFHKDRVKGDAGVMMIIADYQNEPSVLFTLRASTLNAHKGEVSFPGGKKDPTDNSILDCALREVEEEICIPRSCLSILGCHNLLPNKTGTLAVHPFVSVLNYPIYNVSQIEFNTNEVEKVFFTPLKHLLDSKNQEWRQFRNMNFKVPVFKPQEGINHEIWGLTGFILYNCLKTMYPQNFKTKSINSH